MKKILLGCTVLIVLLAGCGRENGETHHSIEAEGYTLTVRGMRIMKESQIAEIPIDTAWYFGDTVRMHEEVTALALRLEDLSEGVISYREPTFFKGYYVLDTAGDAPQFLFFDEGDVTGINSVNAAAQNGAAVYDLQGRRVNGALKGVYIVNGKKVLF